MARGSEGKSARKQARKEARAREAEPNVVVDDDGSSDDEDDDDYEDDDRVGATTPEGAVESSSNDDDNGAKAKSSSSKSARARKAAAATRQRAARGGGGGGPPDTCCGPRGGGGGGGGGGIKTLPLVMLIMLTGTTLLPAILYAGDYFSAYLSKSHFMGNVGHRLGIGPNPKKRVISFYEKHDPDKLHEVPSILAKYYGDYPKLVKRLERKYADYGYFLNWEQDEAAMTLAFEKIFETRDTIQRQFDRHAPALVKTGARNVRHNLGYLYRRGNRLWRKRVWPMLEPYLGVPDARAARRQKLKDKKDAEMRKKQATGQRRKSADFRDEDDDNDEMGGMRGGGGAGGDDEREAGQDADEGGGGGDEGGGGKPGRIPMGGGRRDHRSCPRASDDFRIELIEMDAHIV
ncbi:hypothetical protein ACHAW5_006312 [Stephanodiscus triporus]|uniref:Uncharacterized protein n=1 Tax=Stephanodiscus triporus TaxID=2934178 RepID=A0ABD3MFF1_9STRA